MNENNEEKSYRLSNKTKNLRVNLPKKKKKFRIMKCFACGEKYYQEERRLLLYSYKNNFCSKRCYSTMYIVAKLKPEVD